MVHFCDGRCGFGVVLVHRLMRKHKQSCILFVLCYLILSVLSIFRNVDHNYCFVCQVEHEDADGRQKVPEKLLDLFAQ